MINTQGEEGSLRKKVWNTINLIQANQLFVHSKNIEIKYFDEVKNKTNIKILPEILSLCVLNALVPNSAMLLVGGHGGGKTTLVKLLGRMFTGMRLEEIENSIVRGHPQLTEEKLTGTLKLGKLMKDGTEEVVWRQFVTGFWKIIDEVNRLTPYSQDILLSLLAEGKVKYYDAITTVEKYTLYSTINPQDVGTFELSQPFLDRFGISVPISMPSSNDLSLILTGKDEKYTGYDELIEVPKILSIDALMEIWYYVNRMRFKTEVNNYIHAIIRECTLCARVDKGNSENLRPSSGLCSGCHFNTDINICNKIDSILSVRVAKDLLRYSKALAWLMDLNEVDVNIVNSIAPYVISHRVNYRERELEKAPFWGNKYEFTKHIIEIVNKRYFNRKPCYDIATRFRDGVPNEKDLDTLSDYAKNDLIVKYDILPFCKAVKAKKYAKLAVKIDKSVKSGDLTSLTQVRDTLINDLEFPNRAYLINWCDQELYKQTVSDFTFKYSHQKDVWVEIATEFPNLDQPIKEALSKRQTKQIRTEDVLIETNVTGTDESSIVNIQISGGANALKLRSLLESLEYLEKE
ncbi:MAG: MoxR family ATPase [Candidatus Lokiarchaeota archaeon]